MEKLSELTSTTDLLDLNEKFCFEREKMKKIFNNLSKEELNLIESKLSENSIVIIGKLLHNRNMEICPESLVKLRQDLDKINKNSEGN